MSAGLWGFLGAVFTGCITFFGVVVTNSQSNKKVENKIITGQEVMKTEIVELRKEVEKHNNFAMRVPVLEEQVKNLQEDIKDLKAR